MENYLQKLNEQQRAAVSYLSGSELVIAGAGSGKTRVLTHKIVHLLHCGYEPWRIMALTFTNKAAREMAERVETLLGANTAHSIWMGTFHSIFARILRAHADKLGFKSSFTIYDTSESKALIKMLVKEQLLDPKIYTASAVLSAISAAKNALVSPEMYNLDKEIMQADERTKRPQTCTLYTMYMQRCKLAGAMDFDDLLYYTNVLFRDFPDVLEHYRKSFKYILVDEYQDTNFAQHTIVAQLTRGRGNLCVVGDDAQSIYSFRGANISNILDMKKFYPDLEVFKLERNYRSTKNIINAANSLIEKNTNQIPKNIFSENDEGEPIGVLFCESDREESREVVSEIFKRHFNNCDSYSEYAILYRTNAQSRLFEEELRNRNIPYRIWGGMSFFQRKEVKDVLAYLRVAVNHDDDESLKRIINYPARSIGDTTVQRISACAIREGVSLWTVISNPDRYDAGLKNAALKRLADFAALVQRIGDYASGGSNALDSATKIIDETGIVQLLLTEKTPENISRRENISELLNSVRQFVDDNNDGTLVQFLTQASLATDQDSDPESTESVTLMTVHAAKGLEFDNVYVVGVEDDLFPSMMSKDSLSSIEEERRLLYVAITRARHFCMLSLTERRYRNGQTYFPKPSPFMRDISHQYFRRMPGSMPLKRVIGSDTAGMVHKQMAQQPVSARPTSTPATASGDFKIHTVDEVVTDMDIEHSIFGKGRITDVDAESENPRITVDFGTLGVRTLMLRFARFTIL